MTVYVSISWSDSKLSLLSFFFILDKVIILIAWALNETFDIEASNSTSETIHRISWNSCFYLTVKYISAYIFKTFDKSLSSNLSVLFSMLSHHHQWNTFRPILLLRPDSQPPEPHILYPSIHPSPYYSILFHSTHLFPFSCVQKGFKLTICCPRCPSSMIDPNIYKSFHISPIHPNYLSIPWRCQKYGQHELKRESRHVTTIALATQNPFLFSHFSLTSWHMSSRVEWYGMRWTCVGGHALLCWVVSIWNGVI